MIYGSVCSGIEAASVAWHPLGWRAAFLSEIEPFPRAVLAHHFADTPLHGDFTTIETGQYQPIDLLVGGTPCQDFSIAGLRAGMVGDRGNLTLQFLTLARRLRPKWLVWENVPGVLSSNEGRDFGSFLGGLGELRYGWAYRTLDAQHFGVPQRRRRVFVVGYLGDWRRAAAVLFERQSLSGHPAPRRETGERVARPIASCAAGGSGYRNDADAADNLIAFGGNETRGPIDVATARNAHAGPHGRLDFESETFLVANSLRAQAQAQASHRADTETYVTHSLRADGFDASEDGKGRGTPLVPISFALRGREGGAMPEMGDGALSALRSASGGSSRDYLAFNSRQDPIFGREAQPLGAKDNGNGLLQGSAVRRLTPLECERLQGFPDGWTDIRWKKKRAPDGPRYKALGNSMAVPVMHWIGQRIAEVDERFG